jgi:cysteine desulfurase/selenocysteine lyase
MKDILKPNDEIVLTYGEHSSNILPWMETAKSTKAKIKYVGVPHKLPDAQTIINGVSAKTRVVSFSNVSNLLGYSIDVAEVVKHIRKINKDIIIVLDAAQSAPHMRFDFKKLDVDFMACSAHKMLASTGTGALYINSR